MLSQILVPSFCFSMFVNANISKLTEKLQTNDMQMDRLVPGMDRQLSDFMGLSSLNGYGCWCYFDTHHEAKGPVQDIYDSFCRDLHRAYGSFKLSVFYSFFLFMFHLVF